MAYEVDDTDLKIIEVLKEHAEYTVRKIAQTTLLPATTVHRRLQKLKSEKIIKRCTVDLDYGKLGKGLLVYVLISLDLSIIKQNKKTQHDVVKELRKLYFVEEACVISGRADLIIKVRAKDVNEFETFLTGKIQPLVGIAKTEELIVLYQE